mmetsp:Transcript_8781/g.22932  ORF Transcript_8781/g.22932 Transcript_8781/m.22932 type:complete len:226 (-) Transcript_8781:543-1220(-)
MSTSALARARISPASPAMPVGYSRRHTPSELCAGKGHSLEEQRVAPQHARKSLLGQLRLPVAKRADARQELGALDRGPAYRGCEAKVSHERIPSRCNRLWMNHQRRSSTRQRRQRRREAALLSAPVARVHVHDGTLSTLAAQNLYVEGGTEWVVGVPECAVEAAKHLLDQRASCRIRLRVLQHPLDMLAAHKLWCDEAQQEGRARFFGRGTDVEVGRLANSGGEL